MLVLRSNLRERVQVALGRARSVMLVGPRQSGKTTLARSFMSPESSNYFDLEDPTTQASFESPKLTLSPLQGLVVIDEVQRVPELFPILRVLIDRSNRPGQFLLLGSASPQLLGQASGSLPGRVEVIEITPFDLLEVGGDQIDRLWLRGGFPRAFLARSDVDAGVWCTQAAARFVESDLPQFGVQVAVPTMMRFWTMLAHFHGQVWNAADLARSMGVGETTVRRYLDTLTQALMVRQLQPWYENLSKRQVKSPRIYLRDSGLLHALLGIRDASSLRVHPRSGASWEGFALEQVLRISQPDEAWFWATHSGAELDLLMMHQGRRVGVEFKRQDAPRLTPAMRIARDDLSLDALYVAYPGTRRYSLEDRIEVVPLAAFAGG